MMRESHAFICVDVVVDGKKIGGNGTFMKVSTLTACKDVLATFLKQHAIDYHPLPNGTKASLSCVNISDTIQGRPATDVEVLGKML